MARPKKETNEEIPKVKTGGLLSRLKTASKSEYAQAMNVDDDFVTREFIDSGNVMFNVLLSGEYDKGYPSGKVVSLAGVSSVGKTYMGLEALRNAQALGYTAVIYDSEFANNDKEMLKARGINLDQLLYIPVDTVESLKTSLLNLIEEIGADDKVIVLIDSIGNLSTVKELADSIEGSEKKDMTRAAQVKALFRTVTLKAGIKQVPVLTIQHTYTQVGSFIPSQQVSGGSGVLYNSSIIVEFTKAQDKDKDGVVGSIITAKNTKNRFAKEKSKVKFGINYTSGINRYSGLLEWCEESGFFKKDGRGYIYQDKKFQKSDITVDFWETLLAGDLGKALSECYKYQSSTDELLDDIDDEDLDPELLQE